MPPLVVSSGKVPLHPPHLGQAAQPLIQLAIGPEAISHQTAVEGRAEHLAHDVNLALDDHKRCSGGTGEHPQPPQPTMLHLIGLIGAEQFHIARRRLDVRFDQPARFVETVVDHGGG